MRNADCEYQRALERMEYAHKVKLEEQEELKRIDLGNAGIKARALTEQLDTISKMIENAKQEERQKWLDEYYAVRQTLNNLLGLGNVGGTPFTDPNDIVNWLANE